VVADKRVRLLRDGQEDLTDQRVSFYDPKTGRLLLGVATNYWDGHWFIKVDSALLTANERRMRDIVNPDATFRIHWSKMRPLNALELLAEELTAESD
jgi:hypothetical protein